MNNSVPKPPKSNEPAPRTSLSERLGSLLPESNIDGLPDNSDQRDNSGIGKNARGTKLGISTAGLEQLPPARVTTPSASSPSHSAGFTAGTRSKLSSNEVARETGRVQVTYAPSAIESLQDALSEDLTSSIHQRSPSSASSAGMPPSFLSLKTPRFLDGLTRSTMPTASLSVPPKAYLHTPIPSPFRDTARATAQTEALLNPPVASSQSAIASRRSESPLKTPTFMSPTRSSIDTLRGTLQRSDSMHTSASQNRSLSSWWFGDNKQNVDKLLDESDRAETAEEERDGFRSKYLTPHNPIVFCHGLFGFDTITLGPSFAPLSIPHWRGISEVLAAAGADVLVTRVPATSAVPARAAVLRKRISEVYPGRDIHLIGHSMGGLDCRYLVHELMKEAEGGGRRESADEVEGSTPAQQGGEYRREGGPERAADEEDKLALAAELKRKGLPPFRVLSLTTIATPHRGSAFADYFLSTLGRRNIPGFVSLMEKLPIGGGDGKAFESLTLDSMRQFNEETPDDPNVHYFSWGSKFEPGVLDALGFGFSHKIIMQKEGPNDGLVSVKSARWGTYLGTLDGVNHLELVGWVNEARNTITEWMGGEANFRPATFYLGVANHLAETIEGQERRTNDVLDPGAQLVKEPESIQGMAPEKSLPKKRSASFQPTKKKISIDSRGRTIED
ncbi:triacylglycerol lipase [Rhizoctonia solani AG-3 Rhs1AP]|uniref:Triacylglycerol lipase n=1 Tax=Rhizoctonia solani AG-3 Rhs1AP TaxID=1086054 RepID=X8JJH0_9AGAM|nr:triacylglycerol lipase [Rhizoctonia solani AG-3 Rhs1AP]